jgi:hypothetical protein
MTRIDEETLLNRAVDGENTAEEAAALEARLARDPGLRARHEGLRRATETLGRVEEVEAPRDLVDGVLLSIRARRPLVARRAPWGEPLLSLLAGALRSRPVVAFASGLALGVLVAALVAPSLGTLERSEIAGTILPPGRLGHLETVELAPFQFEGGRGEATTKRGPGVVVAEVRLDSPPAIDLAMEFDAAVFAPRGFERSGGGGGDVVLGRDRLRLTHSGVGRYVLVLDVREEAPSQLRLKVSGNGASLEKTLETRPKATNFSGD